jgi:hypothetical protein
MKRSPIQPGTNGLKRSPMARGTATLARTPIKRAATPKAAPVAEVKQRAPKKRSRGLKGRAPTAAERAFMDRAGQVPCMACTKDGRENRHISLHHVDGRTKPGAHFLVLPLCGPHHQPDDTDPLERVSLHGAKKIFGQMYGTEQQMLAELYALLDFSPPEG